MLLLMMMPLSGWSGQLNLRQYDTRDGIPQIQISSVHQDRRGYLWVGTYGGLARYNGNGFEVMRAESGLSTSYITVVDSDSRGTVWVGTVRGLCQRPEQTRRFTCYNPESVSDLMVNDLQVDGHHVWVGADEGLFMLSDDRLEPVDSWQEKTANDRVVHALALDHGERLWIGAQGGLYRHEGGTPTRVSLPPGSGAVHDLAVHDGRLWIGSEGGLLSLDTDDGGVERFTLPVPDGTRINDILFDAEGMLWLATPEGVVRAGARQPELLTTREGLSNNRTLSLEADREGLIWIGSDQGLIKILPGPFEGFTTETGLVASFVRTLREDSRKRLWLGTREGLQIVPWRDGRWRFYDSTTVFRADGLPDNRIYSIAFTGPDSAWIATAQGVVHWHLERGVLERIDTEDGLPSGEVHSLLVDREGRLWMGSTRGMRWLEDGEVRTPDNETLARSFALRIREDGQGRLWFATLRDGLLIRRPEGTLEAYRGAEGFTDEMLWDLAPAGDDSMWVGSNGDGIFRVWPDGRIERLTSRDGLADDSVWQVLQDDRGRLWAYTNRGLSRLEEGEFTNYSERDGLLHLEGGATGALQTSDGMLWFASADGLMRYDPAREYHNRLAPPVVVESVALDGEPVVPGQRLPYRPGSLSIRFAGLSFQDERAVRFRYRLHGAGDQWSRPVTERRVTFANLGHGDYRFEVIARNPDGVWSDSPASFRFSVAAPFWAESWFILACIVGLGLLFWAVIHLRLRQIEATRRRLQKLVRSRTAELSDANRRLRRMARSDQLTGLPNRRYLFDRIGDDIARSRRAHHDANPVNGDIAFLMVDLDDFKQINDAYGHDVGDQVLLEFSQEVSGHLRESDYMIRWGGEEFLIVACQTESSEAHQIAERIIHGVRDRRFVAGVAGADLALTCSIGIACYPFGDALDGPDWEGVVQMADIAVYQAKERGRDRWVQLDPGSRLRASDDGLLHRVKEDVRREVEEGRLSRREGA